MSHGNDGELKTYQFYSGKSERICQQAADLVMRSSFNHAQRNMLVQLNIALLDEHLTGMPEGSTQAQRAVKTRQQLWQQLQGPGGTAQ